MVGNGPTKQRKGTIMNISTFPAVECTRGFVANLADYPEATLHALAARGAKHVFGNECASKITAWKAKLAEDGREPSEEDVSAKWAEVLAEADAKCRAGELGLRVRVATVDPREAAIERFAKEELKIVLAGAGVKKLPKDDGEDTIKWGGADLTLDDLIERWLGSVDKKGIFGTTGEANRPRVEKKADKFLAEKAKKAKAKEKLVAAAKAETPDELF